MDGLFILAAVLIAWAPAVIAAIMCMQPERGAAPRHWWEQ